jgi:hypothetical protein
MHRHRHHGVFAPNHRQRKAVTSRIAWAKLLARVGEEFRLECPNCGGDIRLIAFITEPGLIRKILAHLREPLRSADACRSGIGRPIPSKPNNSRSPNWFRCHRGSESFQQLGNLENLRAFRLRAMRREGEGQPTSRPRGVLLLSPPGCGHAQDSRSRSGLVEGGQVSLRRWPG